MPDPVAAETPSSDGTRDDAVRLRQPPGDLGRAYRIAFVDTGTLDVVLPATERIPVQAPARSARPTTTAPVVLVPAQRSVPAARPVPQPVQRQQLARRSRALLLGLAVGVVLGAVAVVVTGLLIASLGLLPR